MRTWMGLGLCVALAATPAFAMGKKNRDANDTNPGKSSSGSTTNDGTGSTSANPTHSSTPPGNDVQDRHRRLDLDRTHGRRGAHRKRSRRIRRRVGHHRRHRPPGQRRHLRLRHERLVG